MPDNLTRLIEDLRTQSMLGNKARVLSLCGRISVLDPENPELLVTTGKLAWRHGKRDEAEMLLRRAVERHPDHPESLSSLADIL
ncbi:MAG: tetratricopeptide repeat protein, partial [Rhodospirillales bacterium]|nr:tetratricopeptide repeat protein [Rhodospirillales bacterium]